MEKPNQPPAQPHPQNPRQGSVGQAGLTPPARDDAEFIAMLAHELRNPVAALCTALQVLDKNPHHSATINWTRGIFARQLGNLTQLLDDLLDISRMTHGKVALQCGQVDLTRLLPAALENVQGLMQARSHQVSLEVAPGSFMVYGDALRLEQVFTNLLVNAAKFTQAAGRIEITLSHATRGETRWGLIQVHDSGCGIAPALLHRVFDLFVQSEQPLDRAAGGLGLGLSMVRMLVEKHGGRVYAESMGEGHGSTFNVWLPLQDEAPAQKAAAPASLLGVAPLTVVIVEDNEDARETLQELLESEGHRVLAAQEGFGGVQLIESACPHIAFVDVGLPGLDGYEVARRVRALPQLQFADVHLIALTGYGGSQARAQALSAGFTEHLTKPFKLARLGELLAAAHARP